MALTKKTSLVALLFLCFLLLGSEMTGVRTVEARLCESPSHKFRGLCFSSRNCASICHSEHFSTGQCSGVRRRCMCSKPCQAT